MDQKYNTSFIPKKFLSEDVQGGSASKYVKHRTLIGPGYFIAVIIFVVTLGASIALFAYTRITVGAINEKVVALKLEMEQVKSEDLAEFLELERQMNAGKALLDKHVAISEVLHKLEEKTLRDVQYIAFDYRAGEGTPSLSLGGQARALATIALQIREFENDRQLVKPLLTSLERDTETGLVSLGITTGILDELVLFKDAVREGRHGKSPVVSLPSRPVVSSETPTES